MLGNLGTEESSPLPDGDSKDDEAVEDDKRNLVTSVCIDSAPPLSKLFSLVNIFLRTGGGNRI